MGKRIEDVVYDAALDKMATAVILRVLSGEPTDRADAITKTLGSVALTPGDGNGDFTIANGDVSGRKCTVSAQSDVPISVSGTANHLSLDDGTVLLGATTGSSTAVTNGGTVDTSAFDLELADPT